MLDFYLKIKPEITQIRIGSRIIVRGAVEIDGTETIEIESCGR